MPDIRAMHLYSPDIQPRHPGQASSPSIQAPPNAISFTLNSAFTLKMAYM
jgi:hypothetical protein